MANEKIHDAELLSDDELDNVTGGGGVIYYLQQINAKGTFYVGLKVNGPLTREQVEAVFNNTQEINPNRMTDSSVGKFTIDSDKVPAFVKKWQSKGYQFIDYNSLR